MIAVFYTHDLSLQALLLAALGAGALWMLNARNHRGLAAYLLVGAFIWVCVLKSGVHATLAGVVTALAIAFFLKVVLATKWSVRLRVWSIVWCRGSNSSSFRCLR